MCISSQPSHDRSRSQTEWTENHVCIFFVCLCPNLHAFLSGSMLSCQGNVNATNYHDGHSHNDIRLSRLFPTRMTAFGFKKHGDTMTAEQPTGAFRFVNFIPLHTVMTCYLSQSQPVGRAGISRDLAGIALFLSSSASAHVTGAHILLDGGWSLSTRSISPATRL